MTNEALTAAGSVATAPAGDTAAGDTAAGETAAGNAAGGDTATAVAAPGAAITAEDTVPADLVAEFTSLTTPYCWVITEDPVAGYDGAEPSAVGKFGPDEAVPSDVREALGAGKFFRLTAADGSTAAIGRIYDPGGDNDLAPLGDFGAVGREAAGIQYRSDGEWS